MDLSQKILKFIKTHDLIKPSDKILAGVSGGADSIALLTLLNSLRSAIGFQIHAAHINHHLRKSADQDQRFVEKFCSNLHIPLTSKDIHLSERIKQGGSIEEIAREARLDALTKIAQKTHCHALALAHHRDDLAETVLLRILRGTGLQGLQAILPKRVINGSVVIRPLLDTSREEIEHFLKDHTIKFRNDPTNQHTHFFRNKIRLQLLPYLEKDYQGNIKELLCHLAATAGEDYDYLRRETIKIFPKILSKTTLRGAVALNCKKLSHYPNALQRMIFRFAVEKVQGDTLALDLSHLAQLHELIANQPSGTIVSLPHGIRAMKTKTSIVIPAISQRPIGNRRVGS